MLGLQNHGKSQVRTGRGQVVKGPIRRLKEAAEKVERIIAEEAPRPKPAPPEPEPKGGK